MRDHGVRWIVAVDLSGEALGVITEIAVLKGWATPDETRASEIMDDEPLIVSPTDAVAVVARRLLEARATGAVVAPPVPTEASGQWSEWKERGLPLGTVSVGDILSRLEELEGQVRATIAGPARPGRNVAPLVAAAAILGLVVLLAVVIFLYATGTHHLTNRPGL
jgi:CBS domain-containing protein